MLLPHTRLTRNECRNRHDYLPLPLIALDKRAAMAVTQVRVTVLSSGVRSIPITPMAASAITDIIRSVNG